MTFLELDPPELAALDRQTDDELHADDAEPNTCVRPTPNPERIQNREDR